MTTLLTFKDSNHNDITNPLVPIGQPIQLTVVGGTGTEWTWSWSAADPALSGITVGFSAVGRTATFTVVSGSTVGVAASIKVTDNKDGEGTTMIIAAPQGVTSQRLLLIYGFPNEPDKNVKLCVRETGVCETLHAVPGVINTASSSPPLYQVVPKTGEVFVSCYVLNLRSTSFGDWAPGCIQTQFPIPTQLAPQSQRAPLSQRQPVSQRQPPSVQVVA